GYSQVGLDGPAAISPGGCCSAAPAGEASQCGRLIPAAAVTAAPRLRNSRREADILGASPFRWGFTSPECGPPVPGSAPGPAEPELPAEHWLLLLAAPH